MSGEDERKGKLFLLDNLICIYCGKIVSYSKKEAEIMLTVGEKCNMNMIQFFCEVEEDSGEIT